MAVYREIENHRKELYSEYKDHQKKGWLFITLSIVSIVLFILLSHNSAATILALAFIILLVIGLVQLSNANKVSSKFSKYIKTELVDNLLSKYFDEYEFHEKKHISIETINKAGLVARPDRYRGEDYIQGKYKNVGFSVSDIRLEERQVVRTKNGTVVTYVPYFVGRWYIYKFPKKFDHVLKIVENRYGTNTRGLSKYDTEMLEFNKKFSIYSSNESFFYQIIDPYMIERLLLLEQAHKGNIAYAIIDDELHIGINDNSDSLQLSFKREINESSIIHFEEDIKLIKDIIDELYLDGVKFR